MAGDAPNTRNWKAMEISDFVGPNYRLTVSGEVELTETGTTAKLVKHQPPGFNPAILLLNLEIDRTGGTHGHIAWWAKVDYQQKTNSSQYEEVDVLYHGDIIKRITIEHPKTAASAGAAAAKKKPAKRKAAKKKSAKKKSAKKASKKKRARKSAGKRRKKK
jgi:hypothetical protein